MTLDENRPEFWSNWNQIHLKRRRLLAIAGMAAAGFSIAACGGKSRGSKAAGVAKSSTLPTRGGTLRIGYHQDPQELSPRESRSGYDPNYLLVNGDSYLYVKPDGTVDPANSLVEKYEFVDPTTLVFHLRQGVQFQDGTPLNAEAVKGHLTFLKDKNKAPKFGYTAILDPVKSVEAPEPSTVRITLNAPSPGLIGGFGVQPGMPFSLAQVDKLGNGEILKPIGTGPYNVSSYTSGSGWSYAKNAGFWGAKDGPPFLDKIEFKVIAQPQARAAALQAGDADVVWFDDSDDTSLDLSKNPAFQQRKFFVGPSLLALNANKPPLDNTNVRKAIAAAVDKNKILATINQGQGEVAKTGLLSAGTYGAVEYEPYPFDLAKAKKYLQDSGLPAPVKLILTYSGTAPAAVKAAQLYQSMLDAAGFQTELKNTPGQQQFDVMFGEGGSHLLVFSTGVRPDPDAEYAIYATSSGYYNAGRASKDPAQAKMDDLIRQGAIELDAKKREAIYQQIERTMLDNVLVAIPIVARIRWVFARPNVGGVDLPGFVNTPAGASFRARMLWLKA